MTEQKLEPNGGNLYRPHMLQITYGEFWRCAHGLTGFADALKWVGCEECAKEYPEAYGEWKEEK